MTKKKTNDNTIINNKKASHDYFLEKFFEAGIVLEGWEVKSLRAGKIQIKESYILVKNQELFLFGAYITPLTSVSTHINPDQTRTRKLLLNKKEIYQLISAVEKEGYTIAPCALYWKKSRVKIKIAIAKGKKDFDKRASEKEKDWQKQKARLMKAR